METKSRPKLNIGRKKKTVCAVDLSWGCLNNSWVGVFSHAVAAMLFCSWILVCCLQSCSYHDVAQNPLGTYGHAKEVT